MALAGALAFFTGTAPFTAPAQEAEIHANARGHYVVIAEINGESVRAMIDTGATVVALPWRVAERLGLDPENLEFTKTVRTANGRVKVAPITLERVEIGDVEVDGVDAHVLPRGALHITLIGMSFLSRLSAYASDGGVLRLDE